MRSYDGKRRVYGQSEVPRSVYVQVKWPYRYSKIKGQSRNMTIKDKLPDQVIDILERAFNQSFKAA